MKIIKSNPPINGYDREKTKSAIIPDGRLERLERTLEECICVSSSSKKFSNYNFYWYSENEYQRYCKEEKVTRLVSIMNGMPEFKKDTLLGYVLDKDVYINLDAFPFLTLPETINKKVEEISAGHSNLGKDSYKERCNEILKQLVGV